jgi:NDP-sugar pyrophosphorylase family protein
MGSGPVPYMTASLPPVCILAGGLGTRLGATTQSIPKGLVDVNGEPFLLHQMRGLARQGVSHVVLCVGHLGELIEEALGSEQEGVTITYSYDGPGLDGTLGAIRRARHLLTERFLVLYGDTLLVVSYPDLVASWAASGAPAVMTVLENQGRWDTSNVRCDAGFVAVYDKHRPDSAMTWIDYGLLGLSSSLLDRVPDASDLADLLGELARDHLLAAYPVTERFYEIGTPDALEETRAYLAGIEAGSPHGGAR